MYVSSDRTNYSDTEYTVEKEFNELRNYTKVHRIYNDK